MQAMKAQEINKIFEIFAKENANPQTELEYKNEFTLLVAIVLSAQSTDIQVNKATKKLFEIAKTPQEILKLQENGLKKYINTIGLFNAKAKNIIELSKALIEKHQGKVPNNFDELIELAGVGRKTANVFLNCAHNQGVIAVDTHVFRVANRIGFCDEKTPEKTEFALMKIIPKKWLKDAHHFLILHGRYICKARKPECDKCKISAFCKYYNKQNHAK
jgi:endonuclease III